MNTWKKTVIIITTTLIVIFLVIITTTRKNFQVINAEYDKNYENLYPNDCYVNFKNRKYLTQEIYVYKWNILMERHNPGGESMITIKYNLLDNHYETDLKGFRILSFKKTGQKKVAYNLKEYQIDYSHNDTIISVINESKIIIFIGQK